MPTTPGFLEQVQDALNTQIKEGYQSYKDWGAKNKEWINENIPGGRIVQGASDAIMSALETPGVDVALGMVSPTLKSGRVGNLFKNRVTKVSQFVENNVPKSEEVLDFGAGLHGHQTKYLRNKGYNVTAHDLPENMQVGLHDPQALERTYPNVMASNVLNVQPDKESLSNLLTTLFKIKAEGGKVIANYPKSPRYLNMSEGELANELKNVFPSVEKTGDVFILK
jgi:hypothetical protein